MEEVAVIIEDERNWQRELRRIVEQVGYKAIVVDSKDEGIKVLKRGRVTIAIIDASLVSGSPNDRGGIDVLKAHISVPTICISGVLTQAEIEKIVGEGLAEMVLKKEDFHEDSLTAAMRLVKASRSFGNGRVAVKAFVLTGEILAAALAFCAGLLLGFSFNGIEVGGHGSRFFTGLAIFTGALSIECLIGLVTLARCYELYNEEHREW